MAEVLGVVTVDSKGRASLPQRLRAALGLSEGSRLLVERSADGRIELVPVELIPRDQLYFHTPEMQERIARAEASIREGRSTRTRGAAETQALLDSLKVP